MIWFRDAEPRDCALLGNLTAACFDPRYGEGWSGDQIVSTLQGPGAWGELAFLGDKAAGFSLLRRAADEVELLLIGVRPSMRQLGVGRMLVRRAGDWAFANKARLIHLEVRENNERASRLYDYFGFAPVGRRSGYYSGAMGERFDAITLSCPLPFSD